MKKILMLGLLPILASCTVAENYAVSDYDAPQGGYYYHHRHHHERRAYTEAAPSYREARPYNRMSRAPGRDERRAAINAPAESRARTSKNQMQAPAEAAAATSDSTGKAGMMN